MVSIEHQLPRSQGQAMSNILTRYTTAEPDFSKNFDPPKIIMVKATLENRCSVIDETFVAEAPEQGRRAPFRDGVAIMRLPEGAKIQLAVSSAYPAFRYDDVPQPVAPNVTLVADCDVSPRLRSIFGSMKETFKQ